MASERRKGTRDSLTPVNALRWLVIRDRCSLVLEYRELWSGADLHAAMEAERARRAADGWNIEDVPKNCSFCFADRGNERVCISIECYEPAAVPAR